MSQPFPLEELQTTLEKARLADEGFQQFGASRHHYLWNPPVSVQELLAFENEIGISLPEDYRQFLLQAANGGAGPFDGLFSLAEVRAWLDWPVEAESEPFLYPDMTADDLNDLPNDSGNWLRGAIPIGSHGETYFIGLLLTGAHRGRVVYIDYEISWVFFPREPDFLSWYSRWLREAAAGYHLGWFALYLDGDEAALRQYYAQATEQTEKLLALNSMAKFPALSKETQHFLNTIWADWLSAKDVGKLPKLLYDVQPALYEKFLDKRWKMGLYDQVVYELYHTPADRQTLVARWRERLLAKLSAISPRSYSLLMPLLHQSGGVNFAQIAPLVNKAVGREKYDLLRALGHLPDAKNYLTDFWLPLLDERDDLDLLNAALLAVPYVNDSKLRDALLSVQKAFPFAAEPIVHFDLADTEMRDQAQRRRKEYAIYKTACSAWREVFYETINPENVLIPRPYRLEMTYADSRNLGMDCPPPAAGIALHPLIALAILHESGGRLPSTAWDWTKKLQKIKKLELRLSNATVRQWNDPQRLAYLRAPDDHFPPAPYYFDLRDWSALGRMPCLKKLVIAGICVEDFSFLSQCQNLQTLSLYNTNFTDCRLLLKLPHLQSVDLRLCQLTYQEVLKERPLKFEW